jgi:outer membrane protein assembly factor BamD
MHSVAAKSTLFAAIPAFGRLRAAMIFIVFAALLSGCAGFSADETLGWSAEKLYHDAMDEMASSNWNKASKLLEKLEARYPYGNYAQQGQLELAYAYYKDIEPAQAIAACDQFIKVYPNHENVDYAYYLKGLINFNDDLGLLGYIAAQDLSERDPKQARESFDSFKVLVLKFPDSKYAKDAIARMNYLVNALASSEVHIAQFYLRRGAFVAAINRSQSALQNYPGAPATEEALAIMIDAYNKLGATELRDDTHRVLAMNFPQSRFLDGYNTNKKPWYRLW